jgi:hypothetical protein
MTCGRGVAGERGEGGEEVVEEEEVVVVVEEEVVEEVEVEVEVVGKLMAF